MVAVKERLKCQHCGNELFECDGNTIICVACSRDHYQNGHLIQHPIGAKKFYSGQKGRHKVKDADLQI